LVIFRYFSAIAMAYFAIIISLTLRQKGLMLSPFWRWSWLNLMVYAVLFSYLSWGWLRRKLRGYYLPIALVIAVAAPSLSNLFDYFLPPGQTLFIMVLRSWVLFPILIVPLVLIAWQYRFRHVLLFAILTTTLDEILLIPGIQSMDMETIYVLGQPLVRAFAFGTVGHIVTHLLEIQRAQQRVLLKANLELSQHAQTLEQLATSRERNRLARELHDTLAHTLSGVAVNLEALKTTIDLSQSAIHDKLEKSLIAVRDGLKDTRRALKDLRPLTLEDMGLSLSIQNLAQATAERASLSVQMQISENIHLPSLIEQNVYRIAQEALENVALHASAKNLEVMLAQQDDVVTLVIQDDGIGFEQDKVDREDKFGLKGMQERAALAGGSLNISSRLPTGTKVELKVEMKHD
jgi:signal transduction histidine kinase